MELQQLKYFKTVAEIGKISEAAETLFVSAPALSTSISRLEKELGMQLFDRTNNRITLNEQGKILLKHTDQIFSSVEVAKQEMRQSLQHEPHISLISNNATLWTNLITMFMSEHPQYALTCAAVPSPTLAQTGIPPQYSFLLAYDCDLPRGYADKLSGIFLFQARPMVAVHKDHPLAQKEIIDIPMLAKEKLLMPIPEYPMYLRLKALFAHYGIPFPVNVCHPFLIRQKMVAENVGVSFVTSSLIHTIPSPDIRYIPLEDPLELWNAYLYWRKDRPLTSSEILFKDFCERFYNSLH